MAVRFGCPIYTYDFIMDSAGVILENEQESSPKKENNPKRSLEDFNINALEKLLDEALEKEDYEKAAKIRDVIQTKRSSES
jgi:protein-arginine kinase activator protein McsA